MPPSLDWQLERQGTLPAGLQKRLAPFTREWNRQLPPLPPGHVRGLIGGFAVEAFFPTRLNEVVAICERIAHDIRHQYTIGYVLANPAPPGAYRAIRVFAALAGSSRLFVRTRAGYIAGGAAQPVNAKDVK